MVGLGLVRQVRQGIVGRVVESCGEFWSGMAGEVWRVLSQYGRARHGQVWSGRAGTVRLCRVRQGEAARNWVSFGMAWQCLVRRGMFRQARFGVAGMGAVLVGRGMAGLG